MSDERLDVRVSCEHRKTSHVSDAIYKLDILQAIYGDYIYIYILYIHSLILISNYALESAFL
jgi:hypothetical protein